MNDGNILCAIIVDIAGCLGVSATDERAQHKQRFQQLLFELRDRLEFYDACHAHESDKGIRIGTQLIVYDFGGVGYGNSLTEDNAKALVHYITEHPNTLVIVVSTYTYEHFVVREMRELGLDPKTQSNLLLDNGSDERHGEIRRWFGLPEELPDEALTQLEDLALELPLGLMTKLHPWDEEEG